MIKYRKYCPDIMKCRKQEVLKVFFESWSAADCGCLLDVPSCGSTETDNLLAKLECCLWDQQVILVQRMHT